MNKFENNSTLYLLPMTLFLGLGFKLLLNISGSYSWLSIIIGSLIGLIINKLLIYLIPKIHDFFILLYSSVFLLTGGYIFTKMISKIYLNQTPHWFILIPVILVIFYTISKNKNVIFKVASILTALCVFLLLVSFIALTPVFEFKNLFSYKHINIISLLYGSLIFALLSTIPYTLVIDFKKIYNFKSYLLSSLTLLMLVVLIIGSLTSNVAVLFEYPEFILFKSIHITNFLENMESILFGIWLIIYFPFLSLSASNIKKILLEF